VALVLTSPPYSRSVHGQATARPGRGVAKFDDTYSADPANLGRVNQPTLLKALQQILAGWHLTDFNLLPSKLILKGEPGHASLGQPSEHRSDHDLGAVKRLRATGWRGTGSG
jgi:hypothetical protein